jgi:hypothetical protein
LFTAFNALFQQLPDVDVHQAGVWLSGHFPPLKSHFRLFHAASTKLLPAAVTAHQRDSMLDQICTH